MQQKHFSQIFNKILFVEHGKTENKIFNETKFYTRIFTTLKIMTPSLIFKINSHKSSSGLLSTTFN